MLIGYRDFVYGKRRPVYLDEDGNQFVLNDAGQEVFGQWLHPEDDCDPPVYLGGLESAQ